MKRIIFVLCMIFFLGCSQLSAVYNPEISHALIEEGLFAYSRGWSTSDIRWKRKQKMVEWCTPIKRAMFRVEYFSFRKISI